MVNYETSIAIMYVTVVAILGFFAYSLKSRVEVADMTGGSGGNVFRTMNVLTNPAIFLILLKNALYFIFPVFSILGVALMQSIAEENSAAAEVITILDQLLIVMVSVLVLIYSVTAIHLLKEFVMGVKDWAVKRRMGFP